MSQKRLPEKLNDADRILIARIKDMLRLCANDYSARYTSFLDERQCALASMVLNPHCHTMPVYDKSENVQGFSELKYFIWGGYEKADRKIICIYNEFLKPEYTQIPISCVTFQFRKGEKLTHRDFLGSIMALQIKRQTIGDIIVSDNMSQIFVLNTVKNILLSDIKKVGKVGVKVYDDLEFMLSVNNNFTIINGTVSSLRLDSVVSTAINLSRKKTTMIIRSDLVSLNYFPENSISVALKEGDTFSVRGYGKFILDKISGVSKKGRFHIEIKKFI